MSVLVRFDPASAVSDGECDRNGCSEQARFVGGRAAFYGNGPSVYCEPRRNTGGTYFRLGFGFWKGREGEVFLGAVSGSASLTNLRTRESLTSNLSAVSLV